jgi:hypothetical protein
LISFLFQKRPVQVLLLSSSFDTRGAPLAGGDANEEFPSMNVAQDIVAGLDRILTMELVRVTERAAVAAARLRGRGDEKAADQVAVDAMRQELNRLAIKGTVVIGEGERDEAPMLYIGEEVGTGKGRRSISRWTRSKARPFAPRTCPMHLRSSPSRKRAACCSRPTSTWTRSQSVPAMRTASSTSTARRPKT